MFQPQFPVEAADRSGLLDGSSRTGACIYLALVGSWSSFACSPCWKFRSPCENGPDDETPMLPYIDHNRISDNARLCTLKPFVVRFSGVCARHRSDNCGDPRRNVALPPVPSLLQPAALPTELPGNVVQLKRRHFNTDRLDDIEQFLGNAAECGGVSFITRRNLRFHPRPMRHRYFLPPRPRSVWPK